MTPAPLHSLPGSGTTGTTGTTGTAGPSPSTSQGRGRATPPGQRLRLITLSGYGRSVDHQRSAAAGLERHLVKPVDLDEMIAILNASPSA